MKLIVVNKYKILILALSLVLTCLMLAASLKKAKFSQELEASGTAKLIPIYSVDHAEKKVSVTFDCAWNDHDIDQILDVLAEYDCPATFFVVGDWVLKYRESVEKIAMNKHELANHSYSHKHFNSLSRTQIIEEVNKCNNIISDITGKDVPLFRPPYGEYNNLTIKTIEELGMKSIQWDIDSLDYTQLTIEQMVNRVVPNVRNGSIILLHNGTKHTKDALPLILKGIRDNGFSFSTVSDLLLKDEYILDFEGRQKIK